jgi:hypothetical protein
MRSADEQLQVILEGDAEAWGRAQLPAGVPLADRHYDDFVSVTPDDGVAALLARGAAAAGEPVPGLFVDAEGAQWAVYRAERGEDELVGRFATYEEAVRCCVLRRFHSAWIALVKAWWRRHAAPEGPLPPFGARLPPSH